MANTRDAIVTKGLTKNFGHIIAVDNLSLSVERGDIFGFLGPNGAGKTTTVRILSGLLRASSGEAMVCGYDVLRNPKEVKARTGLLPDTAGIYSKLSAVEFLQFVGALYDIERKTLGNRIDKLLSILGLEGRQDDTMESYSSGMKQKVLVASTIIHNPEVVFLDEPTSRLDPSASVLIREIIRSLAKEMGTTFFICTHMLDFVERAFDKIGILDSGKLVACGPIDSIVDRLKTKDLEQAYLKLVGEEQAEKDGILDWSE